MADDQSAAEASEDLGIAPHKKLKTDFTAKETPVLKSTGRSVQNGDVVGESSTKYNLDPDTGRRMRFHSIEPDDTQSSSGNSSNIENGNVTEEDSGNISDSSSHASSGDWQRRPTGVIAWVHTQMVSGVDPRKILRYLLPNISHVPTAVGDLSLWQLIVNILSEPQRRPKLQHINTLHDAVDLISRAKNILVLTGAGVSVSCGIPDFRSRDGIYARLAIDFPDLPDPQAMFDIAYFTKDPRPFFKFAKEIYPGQFKPSRSHRFISMLQKTGRLLRNYTQNIDTLEQVAGISRVIQCHGSFATASCLKCHHQVDCEVIRDDIFSQHVPRCPKCSRDEELAIMKPDIVFFGESLPEHFHRQMTKDKDQADLMIVIGSSLKVRPVALIPSSIPDNIPQILINREPLPHVEFDVELLGDGDTIIAEICRRLGSEFSSLTEETNPLTEINELPNETSDTRASRDEESNVPESSGTPLNTMAQESGGSEFGQHVSNQDNDYKTQVVSQDDLVSPDKGETANTSAQPSSTQSQLLPRLVSSKMDTNDTDVSEAEYSGSKPHSSLADGGSHENFKDSIVWDESEGDSSNGLGEKPHCHDCMSSDKEDCETLPCDGSAQDDGDVAAAGCDGEKVKPDRGKMWRSRWKQSVSKRLPVGKFYYNGGNRYIFPGAEVAPEEEDDSELSDYDPDSPNGDGKSSDDESDDATPVGPGGLSSTKRDLRTSSTFHTLHQSFLYSCHNDPEPDPVIRIRTEEELSSEDAKEDSVGSPNDPQSSDEVRKAEDSDSIASFPADFSNHLGLDSNSPAVDKDCEDSKPADEGKGSILPDELHELMDTLPVDPQRDDSRSHSPLPPTLHKILAEDPPHAENPTRLLAKTDADVPDTDQILCLPSSSLLPPMKDYIEQAAGADDKK